MLTIYPLLVPMSRMIRAIPLPLFYALGDLLWLFNQQATFRKYRANEITENVGRKLGRTRHKCRTGLNCSREHVA
jgi:hypothetical protein